LTEGWFRLSWKMGYITRVLRDRWHIYDVLCAATLTLIIAAAVLGRALRFDRLLGIPAVIVAIAFICMPFVTFGSAYADMRLVPFGLGLALLAVRPTRMSVENGLLIAGAVFLGLRMAATTASFVMYDQTYKAELEAIDYIPRGSSVLALVARECGDQWAQLRLDHLPSIAVVRRQAFTNDQWVADNAQGLTITKAGVGKFGSDPSQLVYPSRCGGYGSDLQHALDSFNRAAFDYVWLLNLRGHAKDLDQVWSNGHSALYRVRRS
jgi:hypothetical protein